MKVRIRRNSWFGGAALLVFGTLAFSAAPRAAAQSAPLYLPADHLALESARMVNVAAQTAVLPLHKGIHNGTTVWYILTDASNVGIARDLNVLFAPKLANMAIGCPKCVQEVTMTVPPHNAFGEGVMNFPGIPDFSPQRIWNAGAKGFPPAKAQPGAVGDANYSPFIRLKGSDVVYNAPIVAVGDGPFDIIHHTNTQDHVLALDTKESFDYTGPSVTLGLSRGFDSGQPILYLSTEASDPIAATLERATYVPLLQNAPFLGGDDFAGSARERIFAVVNGPRSTDPAKAQGFMAVSFDGHLSEDLTPANSGLVRTAMNIQGDFPTRSQPRHEFSYSPLWDAQVGEWTPAAIAQGKMKVLNDENEMLELVREGAITGPMGAKFGSAGFVINCPPVAFINAKPLEDTTQTDFQQIP